MESMKTDAPKWAQINLFAFVIIWTSSGLLVHRNLSSMSLFFSPLALPSSCSLFNGGILEDFLDFGFSKKSEHSKGQLAPTFAPRTLLRALESE